MSHSNNMFLFEIALEQLKSFTKCTDYNISVRFSDVFTLQLKDPNKVLEEVLKKSRPCLKTWTKKFSPPAKSVLVTMSNQTLLSKMTNCPIELCVFSSKDPFILGLGEIPWHSDYTNYVKSLMDNVNPQPVILTDNHKAYDEYTSKRVASVKLRIGLRQLTGTTPLKRYTLQGNLGPAWKTLLNTNNLDGEESIGQPIYIGNKHKCKQSSRLDFGMNFQPDKEKTVGTVSEARTGLIEGLHPPTAVSDPYLENTEMSKTENTVVTMSEQKASTVITLSDVCQLRRSSSDADIHCEGLGPGDDSSLGHYHKSNSLRYRKFGDLIHSQTDIRITKKTPIIKHWSTTSLEIKERLDTLNYIFGNTDGPFGNQVYCVGYCTVKTDASSSSTGKKKSPTNSETQKGGQGVEYHFQSCGAACKEEGLSLHANPCGQETCDDSANKATYELDICGPSCRYSQKENPCFEKVIKLDIPADAAPKIQPVKCDSIVECADKLRPMYMNNPPLPTLIQLDTRSVKECCLDPSRFVNKSAKMTHGDDPCLCTCDCTFGFVTNTTYCAICGGYEVIGDEVVGQRGGPPFPCPIYHNLTKKKGKKDDVSVSEKSTRTTKKGRGTTFPGSGQGDDKQSDLGKESEKSKKKVDERFKFNYGYKGIPAQIGHSQCAMPCTGDYSNVPKYMGWLWTADNIPGLKRRPGWKPGAANKHVVRLLRIARYPDTALNKKRKISDGKKKRDPKRPLLVVEKKDGEYFVNLETMKNYTKPRLLNQPAFEDKDPLVYKIGRTDEENLERAKRKARARRRLMREQRAFVQSAFHDMCKEICIKTYQQALALMPFGEDPGCPCYPLEPPSDRIDESHSCSCTDSERDSGSATDDDEWIVEFTPPNAYYDPMDKSKRIIRVDTSTQYNYLDYQVKLNDRFGNPIPRFFIGPNGKTECSDLGGFWDPDKKWLKINEDGVVGPDGRWAPNNFIGPCGEMVEAEHGAFEATNGVVLLIGVDGFVDAQGKWRFYPQNKKPLRKDTKQKTKATAQMNVAQWLSAGGCKAKDALAPPVPVAADKTKKGGGTQVYGLTNVASEGTWSCFGAASVKELSKKGIVGHGRDRKLLFSTLQKMAADGEDVKIPQVPLVPRSGRRKPPPPPPRISLSAKSRSRRTSLGITAVSDHGHKTYLKLRESHNPRLKQRLKALDDEGISVSSYHVPCFRSFINTEEERKLITEHILKHNARVMADMGTQVGY